LTGILLPLPNLLPHREGKAVSLSDLFRLCPEKAISQRKFYRKLSPYYLRKRKKSAGDNAPRQGGFLTACQSSISKSISANSVSDRPPCAVIL
jgi:hypothetical protein